MSNTTRLIEYNGWANAKLAEQVSQFSNDLFIKQWGGSFPSLHLTFTHLLEADWRWLYRWKGVPFADLPAWSIPDMQSIRALWGPVQVEMEALAKEKEDNPEELIVFKTRAGDTYQMPFAEIVTHVANHGTYHRGQISNMIRMAGEKPVGTDYFIFYNSRTA